jgi:hypothetical protein
MLVFPLVALLVLNSFGIAYYVSPLGARVRHPLHSLLKPSGTIGQSLGITALGLFLFMWLYPIRKRFRSLAWTGSTRGWLEVHIAAGLLVPLVAATHAGWRFTGLIGLGYGAMFLVCCSGVVGRYLYLKIPRAKSGLELSIEQMESEREKHLRELAATTGLSESSIRRALMTELPPEKKLGVLATFARLVRDDFQRRRAARAILQEWKGRGATAGFSAGGRSAVRSVLAIARREIALSQQIRVLESTHRVFAYWHAAHRPVAVTAFLAVAIHVTVAVVMGATWFR